MLVVAAVAAAATADTPRLAANVAVTARQATVHRDLAAAAAAGGVVVVEEEYTEAVPFRSLRNTAAIAVDSLAAVVDSVVVAAAAVADCTPHKMPLLPERTMVAVAVVVPDRCSTTRFPGCFRTACVYGAQHRACSYQYRGCYRVLVLAVWNARVLLGSFSCRRRRYWYCCWSRCGGGVALLLRGWRAGLSDDVLMLGPRMGTSFSSVNSTVSMGAPPPSSSRGLLGRSWFDILATTAMASCSPTHSKRRSTEEHAM